MNEIKLKLIDDSYMDLSFNDKFNVYYNNAQSYTRHIIEKEINHGHYQHPQFMEIFKNRNAVVIDAGANIGLFSLHISPKCKSIYSIEPTKQHLEVLVEIAKAKNLTCIVPEEIALCNYTGTVKFITDSSNTTTNRIHDSGYAVPCETLLGFITKRKIEDIDLLKLDIEGGEQFVVLEDPTFEQAIKKCKNIYVEIHPPLSDGNAICNKISNLGYNHIFMNSDYLNNYLNVLFYK